VAVDQLVQTHSRTRYTRRQIFTSRDENNLFAWR